MLQRVDERQVYSNILTFYMYEDATVAGGDTITPKNSNRNSSSTSELTTVVGPTISVSGTCIDSMKWGSRSPGRMSRDNEVILKQNSTYLWVFVTGANNNVVGFKGSWYEHTSKED